MTLRCNLVLLLSQKRRSFVVNLFSLRIERENPHSLVPDWSAPGEWLLSCQEVGASKEISGAEAALEDTRHSASETRKRRAPAGRGNKDPLQHKTGTRAF